MMSRSCIPLYGLLLLRTPGASSGMYPDPAGYCEDYADELGCRERHSGGLQCRDPSKCKGGGSSCSDADAARRIGMTCAGFPWWNGGWPLSALHWDEEREFYECDTTASPSGTSDYCSQWITIGDSADEWEAGVCKCTQELNGTELAYCALWSCEQVEVEKCRKKGADMVQKYGNEDGDGVWLQDRFPGFRPSQRGDWDKYPYGCICKDSDNNKYKCDPEIKTEKTDCSCLEVASQGVCKSWYCREYDDALEVPSHGVCKSWYCREYNDALELASHEGVCKSWDCREYDDAGRYDVEHEYYNATAIDGLTGRVHGWVGDIDSRGKFAMAECECTLPSDNGRFCVEWRCLERGLPYFYPNLFYSLFGLVIFLWFFICCSPLWANDDFDVVLHNHRKGEVTRIPCCGFIVGLLALVFNIVFMWIGGVGELIIVLSVLCFCVPLTIVCKHNSYEYVVGPDGIRRRRPT